MENTAHIMQMLSEVHLLAYTLPGLDVLTQSFPQTIYIPALGQMSAVGTCMINGGEGLCFISVSGIAQRQVKYHQANIIVIGKWFCFGNTVKHLQYFREGSSL